MAITSIKLLEKEEIEFYESVKGCVIAITNQHQLLHEIQNAHATLKRIEEVQEDPVAPTRTTSITITRKLRA